VLAMGSTYVMPDGNMAYCKPPLSRLK